MPSRPLRESRSQERRLARELGGKVTPRSGAGWVVKGDVRSEDEMLEAKWTGATQVTIKAKVLEKLRDEAVAELRRPLAVFTVNKQDYVILPVHAYAELRDMANRSDLPEERDDEGCIDMSMEDYVEVRNAALQADTPLVDALVAHKTRQTGEGGWA